MQHGMDERLLGRHWQLNIISRFEALRRVVACEDGAVFVGYFGWFVWAAKRRAPSGLSRALRKICR